MELTEATSKGEVLVDFGHGRRYVIVVDFDTDEVSGRRMEADEPGWEGPNPRAFVLLDPRDVEEG